METGWGKKKEKSKKSKRLQKQMIRRTATESPITENNVKCRG